MKIRPPIDEIRHIHSTQPVHRTNRLVQHRITIDEPMIGTILGKDRRRTVLVVVHLEPVENVLTRPHLIHLPVHLDRHVRDLDRVRRRVDPDLDHAVDPNVVHIL